MGLMALFSDAVTWDMKTNGWNHGAILNEAENQN